MVNAEKLICKIFKVPAPIVFITGRFGSGKTDFSLLIAETLLKNGLIEKVGTNIKILGDKRFDLINSVPQLKHWLLDRKKKLFILDEAGIHIDTRNPLGRINREIRHIGFLLRKFRGKFIFVSQRSKDIEGTFRDTDIWLATFKKLNKKTLMLYSNVFQEALYITDIPKTNVKFDTYDIALFTQEAQVLNGEISFEQQVLKNWLEHGTYRRTALKFNLHTQQVKRIILEQIKNLLIIEGKT